MNNRGFCREVVASAQDSGGSVELQRCFKPEPCWKHHGGPQPWWVRMLRFISRKAYGASNG